MIGLLGSGSWATAVVKILMEQPGQTLCWYVREPEIRESIVQNSHNCRYLGEVELDTTRITICEEADEVIRQCDTVYLVIPTAFLHRTLQQCDASLLRTRRLVSAIKGFIPETDEIVTDYLQSNYGNAAERLAIISGPTHAEEVARERLTFITAASPNQQLAEEISQQLHCRYINTSTSNDMRGIQFATALKNIYAVAAGVCKGMGCGDNLLAVLVSYSIVETNLFLQAIHSPCNFLQDPNKVPPYIGDLLVTCFSQFSRNRTFGNMIGQGYSVRSAQLEMSMIAEGYYAVRSLETIRRKMGMEMPIAQAVYKVLYEGARPDVLLRAWQIHKN